MWSSNSFFFFFRMHSEIDIVSATEIDTIHYAIESLAKVDTVTTETNTGRDYILLRKFKNRILKVSILFWWLSRGSY